MKEYENYPPPHQVPRAFLKRRLHSIAGLFFVLFLCEHLLTNSEAALFPSEQGAGFIRMARFLHSLPYLPIIEIVLLGIPIAIHAILGVIYVFEAKCNSIHTDGSKPYLPFARNVAFTWQRITSIILVVAVIAHVFTMRFLFQPIPLSSERYLLPVTADAGLLTLAPKLKSLLITPQSKPIILQSLIENQDRDSALMLSRLNPTPTEWFAITPDFETAALLLVRETMRHWWVCILYSIFIAAAIFHAANGLWTFAISWGVPLNESGRVVVRRAANLLGCLLAFGALCCIWLTYYVTLRS